MHGNGSGRGMVVNQVERKERICKGDWRTMTGLQEERTRFLKREECVLVLIDIQERLVPAMAGRDELLENTSRLVRFAGIVGIPVICTEQVKLGSTRSELLQALAGICVIEKSHFNCFREREFTQAVEKAHRPALILAGIEAHICVWQTAASGLASHRVQVVSDATASRSRQNKETALERMRAAGVVITTTEMLIYEILQRGGTDEFKAVLKLVK